MSSWIPSSRRTSYRAALVAGLVLGSAALGSAPRSARAADKAVIAEKKAAAPDKAASEKKAEAPAPKPGDREAARRLVLEGDHFYDRKDFARALDRYSQAYRSMPVPTVGIEVIKAQMALGKLVEAQAVAHEVSTAPRKRGEPAVFEEARRRAAQANLRLTGMIPSLWLDVTPPGVVFEVQIDGSTPATSPPYRLNPGPHQVLVRAPGYQPSKLEITLREAERLNRRADLVPENKAVASAAAGATGAAAAAASRTSEKAGAGSESKGAAAGASEPAQAEQAAGRQEVAAKSDASADAVKSANADGAQPDTAASAKATAPSEAARLDAGPSPKSGSSTRTLGWVGLGVAAVAAGAGAYTGIKAFSSKPDCPNDTCTPSQRDDIDASTRMGTIANISVGVAVVAGALGIWALASGGDGESEERASLSELPVTVGLGKLKEIRISGRF